MQDRGGFIERVGDAEVWWIDRPAGPRLSLRAALVATAVLTALLVGILWWSRRHGDASWPWATVGPMDPSAAQVATRYLSLALVGLAYLVARSIPAWIRLRRVVRADWEAARSGTVRGEWTRAAVHLHRYAALARELSGANPKDTKLGELDRAVRGHLSAARRVYVHFDRHRPELPERVEAGFVPRVVAATIAGGWWTVPVILVVGASVFTELTTALQSGQWRPLLRFNFLFSSAILAGYAGVHLLALMGWRRYFRFAPGVAERLTYRVLRSQPRIEPVRLRACDAFLDLTGWTIVLTLIDSQRGEPIRACQLRNTAENLDSCFRALLSTADVTTPPRDTLTD